MISLREDQGIFYRYQREKPHKTLHFNFTHSAEYDRYTRYVVWKPEKGFWEGSAMEYILASNINRIGTVAVKVAVSDFE